MKNVLKDPTKFLPSSRSVAFKKKCWELVSGYPEWLYTAEDTIFDLNLKKIGCNFVFAPKSVVYWKTRQDLKSALKQYHLYGKGDGEGRIKLKPYLLIYIRFFVGIILIIGSFNNPILFVVLLALIISYFISMIHYNSIGIDKNIFFKIFMLFLIDSALIIGYSQGLIKGNER